VGTTVRVNIPASQTIAEYATDLMPLTSPGSTHTSQRSVLYIEDNAVNAVLVEELLRPCTSIRLRLAVNGRDGLHAAAIEEPAAILLDMQLPDLNGLEVLKRLRGAGGIQPHIPIIVLSASAMPDEVAAAREAGATDYWTKPLDFERFASDLLARIQSGGNAA
jgi:CheY-like chemotaxis protein